MKENLNVGFEVQKAEDEFLDGNFIGSQDRMILLGTRIDPGLGETFQAKREQLQLKADNDLAEDVEVWKKRGESDPWIKSQCATRQTYSDPYKVSWGFIKWCISVLRENKHLD